MASESEETRSQDRELSRAGISAFLAIAKAWRLTDDEAQALLGVQDRATFCSWKTAPPIEVPEDVLLRISCVLGIFKALNTLFPDPQQADGWIRRPNAVPLLSGHSALERMLAGNEVDLQVVRNYLDAETGGGS